MPETKPQILHAAAQLERDGHKFYVSAAARASNQLARKMLESFAIDERLHLQWIEQLSGGKVPKTSPPGEIYSRLRDIFANAPQTLRQAAASTDDIQAVDTAIGMETKSADAYANWAKDAPDADTRALFATLVQFERNHREILENTREYLDRTGDWFMQQEGWIFDGG